MRHYLFLILFITLIGACQKGNFDPRFNEHLKWSCGEGAEQVTKELLLEKDQEVQLILENDNFCVGAHLIEVDIQQDGQTIHREQVGVFPYVLNFTATPASNLSISTKVVLGPALILCVRMGEVDVVLNYKVL